MGVLRCSREGCENIMCDRYSDKYGYICDECFEELLRQLPYISISDFMDTEKEINNSDISEGLERYLNGVFKK